MVFALVHFTVGFVAVLVIVSVLPITRYRLTGAYLGGIWALGPDALHLVDGPLGEFLAAVHSHSLADVFFFHNTLDGAAFRANNIELTFIATAALGLSFIGYDWYFGRRQIPPRRHESTTESTDVHRSD